jgi:phenylalanyl-tRNA synthetase beta chain
VLIIVAGARVGRVLEVDPHPDAERVWLATVDIGDQELRIVFGGKHKVEAGNLVPVAPPGVRVQVRPSDPPRTKKMRARTYRGERSHGMLCSLDELGWFVGGPDEVAVLRGLEPGDCLHSLAVDERARHVERPDVLQLADVDPAEQSARTGQGVTK